MLSAMEYPHWLMVAGAVLVVVGVIGFAFSKEPT
jgi:preprotein translocase subunit Sss1